MKLLTTTTPFFQKKGIPSARLDAELLLAFVLKCSRVQLYTRFDQPLTDDELGQFRSLVARRAAREPVAYLLGKKEFWGLDFCVGPGVLIPRPDTEILLEEALRLLGSSKRRGLEKKSGKRALVWNAEVLALAEQQRLARVSEAAAGEGEPKGSVEAPAVSESAPEGVRSGEWEGEREGAPAGISEPNSQAQVEASGGQQRVASASGPDGSAPSEEAGGEPRLVLDVCTGSGILPICMARDSGARAIGVDISSEALEYARRNVELHAPPGGVALLRGDLLAPVPARFQGRFDLITCNPPYIALEAYGGLEPEIVKFEPALALKGGVDGLVLYVRMIPALGRWLKPGGHILFEVGDAVQGENVLGRLLKAGLCEGALLKDLSGAVRVVRAQKPV